MGHEAIQHGLSMRTEEASTHSSTTLREMEDKVTLQKATNKDSMKEYKLNQKKELENLKNEIKIAKSEIKEQIKAVKKVKEEAEKVIQEKTEASQKEADELSEQIRNVAKSAKATLKARGSQKMETFEHQKSEAEEMAEMEKSKAIEQLRIAASTEMSQIHDWKVNKDVSEANVMAALKKEKLQETLDLTTSEHTFDSLESDLIAKQIKLKKSTELETKDIEAARLENLRMEKEPNAMALEDELSHVKATLSSTLVAKKEKMRDEQLVENANEMLKKEGTDVDQQILERQQELNQLVNVGGVNGGVEEGVVGGGGVELPGAMDPVATVPVEVAPPMVGFGGVQPVVR